MVDNERRIKKLARNVGKVTPPSPIQIVSLTGSWALREDLSGSMVL